MRAVIPKSESNKNSSHVHQKLASQFGIRVSMSGKGNCFDNAPIESFWGILKTELVYHRNYAIREEAKQDITEYIEIFYNRQRRQTRLNYQSPAVFTHNNYQQAETAKNLSCPWLTTDTKTPLFSGNGVEIPAASSLQRTPR